MKLPVIVLAAAAPLLCGQITYTDDVAPILNEH